MGICIDEAWEYYTADPDVEYGVYGGRAVVSDEERVFDPRAYAKGYNQGMRYGAGNPNRGQCYKLSRPKPERIREVRPDIIRSCKTCGDEFTSRRLSHRYCTKKCYDLSNPPIPFPPRDCVKCRGEFVPAFRAQKYCGRECYQTYRMAQFRAVSASGRNVRTIPKGFATDYTQGMRIDVLMRKYSTVASTMRRWSEALGLPRRKSHTHREDIPPAFAALYLRGETMPALALHFKVSRPTLVRWRQRLNLTPRPRGNPNLQIHRGIA